MKTAHRHRSPSISSTSSEDSVRMEMKKVSMRQRERSTGNVQPRAHDVHGEGHRQTNHQPSLV
jgi:hypothetical protein